MKVLLASINMQKWFYILFLGGGTCRLKLKNKPKLRCPSIYQQDLSLPSGNEECGLF